MNIASHLSRMAEEYPNQEAIIITKGKDSQGLMRHSHINYQQLEKLSCDLARGLLDTGYLPGHRAAIMIPPSFELFISTFALFKAGIVPVFIDPGIGIKNLKKCLAKANPSYFIGIPKAHLARHILAWNKGSWQKTMVVGKGKFLAKDRYLNIIKHGSCSQTKLPILDSEKDAAILFTSGSTGIPKGALYSHKTFGAQIEALKIAFDIKPGEIDLCTFPLFGLFAPALGMTAVIPEMNFTKPAKVNPDKIFTAIESFGVSNLFGSPALLKTVAKAGLERNIYLPTLKRVISAGAPVPAKTIQQFKSLLQEHIKIYTPYGATEALPVAIANSDEILNDTYPLTLQGRGVCVGKVSPGLKVKIIKCTDEIIDSYSPNLELNKMEIGEIIVSGPQVTKSYFGNTEATKLSKIKDGDNFYHRMGDLGYLDKNGLLWFCGRKSHRVILNPKDTIYTIPGEGILNQHQEVARTAIVGVGKNQFRRPVLCVETHRPLSRIHRDRVRQDLLVLSKKFPETNRIEEILFHRSFPVDIRHNSKIFREKLALWAEGQLK